MKFSYVSSAALLGLFALAAPASQAQVQVTIDAPGVQTSQVVGVITETFDTLPQGIYSGNYVSSIGTYTGGFDVSGPDAWGGSNQTQFFAVGAQSNPVTQSTLTLNGNQSYFGMFYAAADAENVVYLQENGTTVETFNTADLTSLIDATANPSLYYGNPNNGQDGGEPFAYVNFTGTNGTVFNSVVFDNSGSTATGFESDSHSVLPNNVGPASTPEPGALALIGGVSVPALGFLSRKRRRSGK